MKKSLIVLALAGISLPALAEETSPHTVTGNLSLTNDYRYRGVSQTFEDPAIQGGFDYAHSSGVYLGTWASNVSEAELAGANIEWDIYGGYTLSMGDFGINVGGLYYWYPGKDEAAAGFDPNTFEVYAGVTWKWINLKYSRTTTKWFGVADSEGSGYYEANVTVPLPADISLGLHYGFQDIAGDNAGGGENDDYSDWKVSVSKPILGFNVSLAYVDTNIDAADNVMGFNKAFTKGSETVDLADGTFLISVGKTF
jgi:uncharacterized protein (TIGR02001 family)